MQIENSFCSHGPCEYFWWKTILITFCSEHKKELQIKWYEKKYSQFAMHLSLIPWVRPNIDWCGHASYAPASASSLYDIDRFLKPAHHLHRLECSFDSVPLFFSFLFCSIRLINCSKCFFSLLSNRSDLSFLIAKNTKLWHKSKWIYSNKFWFSMHFSIMNQQPKKKPLQMFTSAA